MKQRDKYFYTSIAYSDSILITKIAFFQVLALYQFAVFRETTSSAVYCSICMLNLL